MKTIWLNSKKDNIYAEFEKDFTSSGGKATLKISASRGYAAYVNGSFVSNAQFADMPTYKSVDEIDITAFVEAGNNKLNVIVYHWDNDFATGKVMTAALAFEVCENGEKIAESDASTRAREAKGYRALVERVTAQIGYAYGYDFDSDEKEWENAVEVDAKFIFVKRPNRALEIKERAESIVSTQGTFKYNGGSTAAEKAMNAWLSTRRFADMTGENRLVADKLTKPLTFKADGGDGLFVIFDLCRECAGYLTFSVTVPYACNGILTWGEHLSDLRVRSEIEGRGFATEFSFKDGENRFDEYLHRLGARYLCLFVDSEELTVEYFSVREAFYPFKIKDRHFSDRLVQKIYDTAVRTLQLSAHEHYEDCPWREQALYGMDSRNQMLFGYSAFGEYELPRAILRLFAKSARESGLIELCAPAVAPIVIPSFTLYALLAIAENAEADYNEEFINEILPYAEHAITAFTARAAEHGISAFVEPEYWNFHEWCDGLDGGEIFRDYAIEPYYDAPLTALCTIVLDKLSWLEEMAGREEKSAEYREKAEKLFSALEGYYNEESGLYFSSRKNEDRYGYHAYTQALCLITGRVKRERIAKMLDELYAPKLCVPLTFASLQLKYDAILKNGGDADCCINEVCDIFGRMLYSGATSFWETDKGEADFDDAGSLCHGWSAVPCWLFDKVMGD